MSKNGLVPIGDTLSGMGGPVQARFAKPRPRRATTSPRPIR